MVSAFRLTMDRAVQVCALAVRCNCGLGSHSTSLHPGVQISTGEFNAGGNPAMDQHHVYEEDEILLAWINPALMSHLARMETFVTF